VRDRFLEQCVWTQEPNALRSAVQLSSVRR
jgi:hypothetical protein